MDVEEIALPGIGLRYDFATRSGQHVGVVCHRNGRRDLVIYDRADPDSSRDVLQLSDEEGDVLAELLGAPRIVERLALVETGDQHVECGMPGSERDIHCAALINPVGAVVMGRYSWGNKQFGGTAMKKLALALVIGLLGPAAARLPRQLGRRRAHGVDAGGGEQPNISL